MKYKDIPYKRKVIRYQLILLGYGILRKKRLQGWIPGTLKEFSSSFKCCSTTWEHQKTANE
jgi:hypothetical protein